MLDCFMVIVYQYCICFVCVIMSIYSQTNSRFCQLCDKLFYGKVLVQNLHSANLQMGGLRIDEMVFFRNLTKIGTEENKAIYSNSGELFSAYIFSVLAMFYYPFALWVRY